MDGVGDSGFTRRGRAMDFTAILPQSTRRSAVAGDMMMIRQAYRALALAVLTIGAVTVAQAKPADCFTTDDGNYPCNFRGTDQAGSFTATAPGYPTVILNVEGAGVGYVYKDFGGGKNTMLPGPYYRAEDDSACWDNPDTGDRLCVW